jgi:hypothetical protein
MLWQGEWFLNRRSGTPWNTKVLGKYTGSTRDAVIRARILGTVAVNEIVAYSSAVNRETRAYTVNVEINTIYGTAIVAGPI